jgi:hypothetical protein
VSTRTLPPRPNLDQLKRQAHELHRAHRDGDASAVARVAAHYAAAPSALTLADAQFVIELEYGFKSWAKLKKRVAASDALAEFTPHPRFDEALAALDAGDADTLRTLLASDPTLVHARTNLDARHGYFAGATLLHHVAGNPWRDNLLPKNIVEIARVLLEAGADVHARTLGTNGGPTMGLLVTGKQASDAGVTGPLMDLLLQYGAHLDVTRDDALDAPLANHSPAAAEKMIALGASPDVLAAAALGRMDMLRGFFDDQGRLRSRPRRNGVEMSERNAIGLALLYAYVREQREAVDFLLEKDGNWEMTGVNNGAVLHRAAIVGDLDTVKRLVAKGADVGNRDNPFMTTPLGWAHHGSQAAVFDWLRANCPIDIHDAVQYGFREHVETRLREDPASVNLQRDHAGLPRCAPLHCAAFTNRAEFTALLLERGADPNLLAGNGWTPLDLADLEGAAAVAALLEQHGGKRTAEAAKPSSHPGLKEFERIAADIEQAYRSDDAAALQRIQQFFNRRVTFHDVRTGVRSRLQKDRDFTGDISLAEARDVVAGLRGFASWNALAESVTRRDGRATSWGRPPFVIDEAQNRIELRHGLDDADWDAVLTVIAERKITRVDANGQLSDAVVERLVALDHITHLEASNSQQLTDVGLRRLSALRHLQHLNVSNAGITDAGLDVLRELPELKSFALHWDSHLSDAGLANLTFCDELEEVDLLGSHAGDGVINAITAKRQLRRVTTGRLLTNAGLPLFQRFPAYKAWSGMMPQYSLMSFRDDQTNLLLDGPFTNDGLTHLAGLEGLSGLGFFWHASAITADGLAALANLPTLMLLGCGGALCNDVAMRHIAAMPRLRMLQAQGTVASDAGFETLSRSRSIEYIWGRECPNLTGRGFAALAAMPALRGIGISCKRVDDASLAMLPRFPSLRELMPMDVDDDGFRHVGRCENLERLWCMYCRTTTDAATAHIAGLPLLKSYYAGQTKITDRSLEILAAMRALEKVEFWNCAGITTAGIQWLAALPNLREVIVDGCKHVSPDAAAAFAPAVRVRISG